MTYLGQLPEMDDPTVIQDHVRRSLDDYRTSGLALCISLATFAASECWWFYGFRREATLSSEWYQPVIWTLVMISGLIIFALSFVVQFSHYRGARLDVEAQNKRLSRNQLALIRDKMAERMLTPSETAVLRDLELKVLAKRIARKADAHTDLPTVTNEIIKKREAKKGRLTSTSMAKVDLVFQFSQLATSMRDMHIDAKKSASEQYFGADQWVPRLYYISALNFSFAFLYVLIFNPPR